MQFYLDSIDPVAGERVVIDYEESGVVLNDLLAAVQYLLNDPRKLQVTVYSGNVLYEQLGGTARSVLLAENTDLWHAQYPSATRWCKGTYPKWTLHQYSESGKLDGISGAAVDLNEFNGTDQQLLEWISPRQLPAASIPASPAVLPAVLNDLPQAGGAQRPKITITVDGDVDVEVVKMINGIMVK
jgi:lysozyme